jgi:hypothetical protein
MAIGSEVFDRCVGGIDVLVVVKYGDAWLYFGWKYLRIIERQKRFKIGGGGG